MSFRIGYGYIIQSLVVDQGVTLRLAQKLGCTADVVCVSRDASAHVLHFRAERIELIVAEATCWLCVHEDIWICEDCKLLD